jgi:hypothetical protein
MVSAQVRRQGLSKFVGSCGCGGRALGATVGGKSCGGGGGGETTETVDASLLLWELITGLQIG